MGDLVQVVALEDLGDDIDNHTANDDSSSLPKQPVIHANLHPFDGAGSWSRPMTAGGALSELEEVTLAGGPSHPTGSAPGASSSAAQVFDASDPFSPASSVAGGRIPSLEEESEDPAIHIPTLQSVSSPPATPAIGGISGSFHVHDGNEDAHDAQSPTSSEKAKQAEKCGCAVM